MAKRRTSAVEQLGIYKRRAIWDRREMSLADRIGAELNAKGMSQTDLARSTGLSDSMVSRILSRKRRPSVGTVIKIAEALDVPLERLLPNDEDHRGQLAR